MTTTKKDALRHDLLILLKILEQGDYTILGPGGEEVEPDNLGWFIGDVTIANDDVRVKMLSEFIDELGGIRKLTEESKTFQNALLGNNHRSYALNAVIDRAVDKYTEREIVGDDNDSVGDSV